jgi:hypothetical protein
MRINSPSKTPSLTSLRLSLIPASSPNYPEPPSSHPGICLDNSRDFFDIFNVCVDADSMQE